MVLAEGLYRDGPPLSRADVSCRPGSPGQRHTSAQTVQKGRGWWCCCREKAQSLGIPGKVVPHAPGYIGRSKQDGVRPHFLQLKTLNLAQSSLGGVTSVGFSWLEYRDRGKDTNLRCRGTKLPGTAYFLSSSGFRKLKYNTCLASYQEIILTTEYVQLRSGIVAVKQRSPGT